MHELRGVLNPPVVAEVEMKIESIDKMADSYRLKALWEGNERKESFHKSIYEAAQLKVRYVYLTETNEETRDQKSNIIVRQMVEGNESIHDLSRLEQFKQWAKENTVAISVAVIITTIIVGVRNIIKKVVKSTGRITKAWTTNSTIIEFVGSSCFSYSKTLYGRHLISGY